MACANLDSTLAKLNDENLQTSLKQSDLLCAKLSATQVSELIEIKSHLEENNALAKVAASETKELSSRFDMYVGLYHYLSNTDTTFQELLQELWGRNSLIHAEDMVSLGNLLY